MVNKIYQSIMFHLILVIVLLFLFPGMGVYANSQVKIYVDPRIELITTVQLLSDYFFLNDFEFKYKDEILKYFSDYKSHPAVQLYSELSKKGFNFSVPLTVMLHLTDPPELKIKKEIPKNLLLKAGGEKSFNNFLDCLRDFARESNFMQFYVSHQEFYRSLVKEVEKFIGERNLVKTLEEYFRMEQAGYSIILAPLIHQGGFGPRLDMGEGKYDIYDICGPGRVKDGIPYFASNNSFIRLTWHEFSHSFVNPVTSEYIEEINKYSSLYQPIADKMKNQNYYSWEVAVNEHIVRAVCTRLTWREFGEDSGKQVLIDQKNRGFVYIELLCDALEDYENNKNKYISFRDFYPEIINLFARLYEEKPGDEFYNLPFYGPIDNVCKDSCVIIFPTGEKDKEIEHKIYDYIKNFRDTFLPEAPLLMDKEALKKDLSRYNIIVFGTVDGNLWLRKFIKQLPVKIKRDRIIANREYRGNNLRFITAWPNPQNKKKGVLIYTAQRAEDILFINNIIHGSTDYVVIEGNTILYSGFYRGKDEKDGKWKF